VNKFFCKLETKTKGQGIVEYALLLAFIVGLAMMLNGSNLGSAVKGVFNDVAVALGGGKGNAYASALKKWGTISWDKLISENNSARIAADLEGLENIANYFNSLDKSFEELAGNNSDNNSYLGERWTNRTDLGNNPEKAVEGSVVFYYWGTEDNASELSKTRSLSATDWMQGNFDTTYDHSYTGSGIAQTERYFFSNEMNANMGSSEKEVRVAFTKDSTGNVTGTRVWVTQKNGGSSAVTAIDENGTSTTYSVYVPKK
jgi:Flp pilus assembly pilin Flp